jgi:hypothetical protein
MMMVTCCNTTSKVAIQRCNPRPPRAHRETSTQYFCLPELLSSIFQKHGARTEVLWAAFYLAFTCTEGPHVGSLLRLCLSGKISTTSRNLAGLPGSYLTKFQFSKKQFETLYEKVFPIIKTKYTGRINVVFRQQVQPWHPSSTLVHEAGVAALRLDPKTFWAYSAVLFKHQTEFFDVNVVNETRNQTYRRLAKLYGALGASGPGTHQADEDKLYELLVVGEKAGEGGALNIGNKVTDDLKLLIKLGRQTGIHVSPTVLWDGLVDNSISSSWTVEQWDKYFEEKVHK